MFYGVFRSSKGCSKGSIVSGSGFRRVLFLHGLCSLRKIQGFGVLTFRVSGSRV